MISRDLILQYTGERRGNDHWGPRAYLNNIKSRQMTEKDATYPEKLDTQSDTIYKTINKTAS